MNGQQIVALFRYASLALSTLLLSITIIILLVKKLYMFQIYRLILYQLISIACLYFVQLTVYNYANTLSQYYCTLQGYLLTLFDILGVSFSLVFIMYIFYKIKYNPTNSFLCRKFSFHILNSCTIIIIADAIQLFPILQNTYQAFGWSYKNEYLYFYCEMSDTSLAQKSYHQTYTVYNYIYLTIGGAQIIFTIIAVLKLIRNTREEVAYQEEIQFIANQHSDRLSMRIKYPQGIPISIAFASQFIIEEFSTYFADSKQNNNILNVFYQIFEIIVNSWFGIVLFLLCLRIIKKIQYRNQLVSDNVYHDFQMQIEKNEKDKSNQKFSVNKKYQVHEVNEEVIEENKVTFIDTDDEENNQSIKSSIQSSLP